MFSVPNRFLALNCLLALLAPACAPYTKFSPQPLDAGVRAQKLIDRALSPATWTLQKLIDEALMNHPDIAVAKARYAGAVAAVGTAGERPNPTIALSPQVLTPITNFISGTYGVDFDWTIETAGKRKDRQNVAHAQVRKAAANVIDANWKVRSAVRTAFLELYVSTERSKLLNDAIGHQQGLLEALDVRVKAGSESRSATTQARLLQAQMRLQAAESVKIAAAAKASLAESLAIRTAKLEGIAFSYSAFETTPTTPPGPMKALTHRADVLASLADYAAAEEGLRLEIAKQYPDLHLNPGYQLDAGQNKWTLGVGLTLPLLNHNANAVAEAEAKRREAAAGFDSVQANVLADVDRATEALKAARVKLTTTEALLKEQAEQIVSFQRLVDAGASDRSDLLSAQVERATTLTSRIDALADIQAALGALEAATQTPLTP